MSVTRGERGGVMVMVALWLPLLLLIAVVVLDVGNWFEHRRHLQLQVDAAAFAGGSRYQNCFGGAGHDALFREASTYAGAIGSYAGVDKPPYYTPWNAQVGGGNPGGNTGSVVVLYNSKSFDRDKSSPPRVDDTTADPCVAEATGGQPPRYMFDVKASEEDLPLFFGGYHSSDFLKNWLGLAGNGFASVFTINAHARVQLNALSSANPSMPLAVPDINPKSVSVTFVNKATGAALSSCAAAGCVFALSKQGAVNGLNQWSAPASFTPAAGTNVAMRVAVGATAGSCAAGVTPNGYLCYDVGDVNTGLLQLRAYPTGGTPTVQAPVLRAVWPTTQCAGDPFFSDHFNTSGAASCGAGVAAVVDFGIVDPTTVNASVTATVQTASGGGGAKTFPLNYNATSKRWETSGYPFSIPYDDGAYTVTINWSSGSGTSKASSSFTKVQQFYSGFNNGDTSGSGPVQLAQLTGGSGPSPYALPGGQQADLTVTLGLAGNYTVAVPCAASGSGSSYSCPSDPPRLLRFSSNTSSRTYAIDCGTPAGGSGPNNPIYQQIRYGCTKQFSINEADLCPDPANPNPPSCAPISNVGSGDKVGPVQQAMNDRFAPAGVCSANDYPTIGDSDPRVVVLIVTDFSAFYGSGGSGEGVPVVTYAAFYVTGWSGAVAGCNGINEAPPPSEKKNNGNSADVWGHFITYVSSVGTGTEPCAFGALNPCVPVLTN